MSYTTTNTDMPNYWECLVGDLDDINNGFITVSFKDCSGAISSYEIPLSSTNIVITPEAETCAQGKALCTVKELVESLPDEVTPENEEEVEEIIEEIDTIVEDTGLVLTSVTLIKYTAVKSQLRVGK